MFGLTQFFALRAGGTDQVPDAVNWANISGASPQSNADQTMQGFTGSLTLRATFSAVVLDAGPESFAIHRNGASVASTSTPANGGTLDATIASGNTIHFEATKGLVGSGTTWSCTVTVSIVETGQVIDTFTVSCTAS
jgi:hypothetical protein